MSDASERCRGNPHCVHNPIPIVALVGPTASGKTALSIRLAQMLGGADCVEIVSADAMQLYRGMDIGTAKATAHERQGIRHHQIDVLDVRDEASVAVYQREARKDIEDIIARGKIPMLVGGSGLYVSAALDELKFPGASAQIRAELEEIAAAKGLEPLIAELRKRDPRSAAVIDLANPRRVIRALEVVRLTGESFTPIFPRHTSHYSEILHIGIKAERPFLDPRIEQRARNMFENGLLEETRELLDQGLKEGPTACKATGYSQAINVLEGNMGIDEAIESTALATRHLAKKQRTWFKADKRIEWLRPDPDSGQGEVGSSSADTRYSVDSGDDKLLPACEQGAARGNRSYISVDHVSEPRVSDLRVSDSRVSDLHVSDSPTGGRQEEVVPLSLQRICEKIEAMCQGQGIRYGRRTL